MNLHGFSCGKSDGDFGPKTLASVNRAQQFWNLQVDGVIGPKTWEKLREVKKK